MRQGAATYALMVMLAINLLNFYDRQVIGAVGEAIKSDWSLSDSKLGVLNIAFTLLYAVVGLPFGWWTDRGKRTRILMLGVSVWSVFTALSGLARNYGELFVIRLGVGFGEATCAPAATSIIGDYFHARGRARALSVFMLGLPVGLALAYAISGPIATRYGWSASFFVAAAPGLLCLVALFFVKEPQRGAVDDYVAVPMTGMESFRRVLSIPTIWWIIVSGAIHNFNMYVIGAYQSSLLIRYHFPDQNYLDVLSRVSMLSTICTLAGVPGLLIAGYLGDLFYRRSPSGRMLVGTFGLSACVLPWLGAVALPHSHPYAFAALAAVGSLLMYFYYSTVYSTIHDVVEPSLRGTAMALYFMAMYPLGASLGPWVAGSLSDYCSQRVTPVDGLTEQALGLRLAFFLVPALYAVLAFVLFAASRTVGRDVERRNARMGIPASEVKPAAG